MSEPEGFKGAPGEWWVFVHRDGQREILGDEQKRVSAIARQASVGEEIANAAVLRASKDLLAALQPFDEHAKGRCADSPEWDSHNTVSIQVTIGELRAARAAIAKALPQEGGQ